MISEKLNPSIIRNKNNGLEQINQETISLFLLPDGPAIAAKLFHQDEHRERASTMYEQQAKSFQKYVYPMLGKKLCKNNFKHENLYLKWIRLKKQNWEANCSINKGNDNFITINVASLPINSQKKGFCWVLHKLLVHKTLIKLIHQQNTSPFANPEYRNQFASLWQSLAMCLCHQTSPIPQQIAISPMGWRMSFLMKLAKENNGLLEEVYRRLLMIDGFPHNYKNPEDLFSGLLGTVSLKSCWHSFLEEKTTPPFIEKEKTLLL